MRRLSSIIFRGLSTPLQPCRLRVITAVVILLSLGAEASAQDLPWEIERIDEREGFMHSASIAVDSNDVVYVSYKLAASPTEVYVAQRNQGVWSRDLVGFGGSWGTYLSINPVTGLPGLAFRANQAIEFWEYDGFTWVQQSTEGIMAPNAWVVLTYSESGTAYLGFDIRTTVDEVNYWYARVLERVGLQWQEVPIAVQSDWVNVRAYGSGILAIGSSTRRPDTSLKFLDVMRSLPISPEADVIDMLPDSAVSGSIQNRGSPISVDLSDHIHTANMRRYTTDVEPFAELRFHEYDGVAWNSETIEGGGEISNPESFGSANLFSQHMALTVTDNGKSFVIGTSEGFDQISYAFRQNGNWSLGLVDSYIQIGGQWRGQGAAIDPDTGTPIVCYTKGSQHGVDMIIHVARLAVVFGDVDASGVVDIGDVSLFVAVLLGQDTTTSRVLATDINSDGVTDGLDIQLFVEILLGG